MAPRSPRLALLTLVLWSAVSALAEVPLPPPAKPVPEKIEIAPGPFKPTWESLTTYKCPDWYRDAKLGIWAIQGVQSLPEA
ncbi:MAG TPA: alpha-L-fucosidase, partial [Phycisphaerae bacterium]|nr:alpha-L-fucosidase [Phycisphaerae bacterium]